MGFFESGATRFFGSVWFAVFVTMTMGGCGASSSGFLKSDSFGRASEDDAVAHVKTIAVLDFGHFTAPPGADLARVIDDPMTKFAVSHGQIDDETAGETVAGLFVKRLRSNRYAALDQVDIERVAPGALNSLDRSSVEDLAKFVDRIGVNMIIVGMIYRYRDRVGSGWSVDKPAAVAFAVAGITADRRKVVWRAGFNKEQRPLSEDASGIGLLIRGNFKWMSANELSSIAVSRIIETSPFARPRPEIILR